VIETLRLHGRGGAILWGYRPIADIDVWVIGRSSRPAARPTPGTKLKPDSRGWQLQAGCTRGDAFALRQRPLYFTAPRLGDKAGGFWHFELLEAPTITRGLLTARLAPPAR
jgi:hypothetical protein